MKAYIENFSNQLKEAITISESIQIRNISKENIQAVLVSGLGGSGISGTIISELVAGTSPIPVCVNKDYDLPAWVNKKCLVLICSYSGNTEETIAVMKSAIAKNIPMICITSGGEVADLAEKNNLDVIRIPGGHPPRASFAYPFVQLLRIFEWLGFGAKNFNDEVNDFIRLAEDRKDEIKSQANSLAASLHGKIPVIYATSGNEGIAMRFRQQINENSKMLAWINVIPEMNHNELVGWVGNKENLAVVSLRTSYEHPRSAKRLEICRELISPLAASWTEIQAPQASRLTQTLYLIHLTDWVSYFLAELKNIDPVEVNVIDYLKAQLSKF